MTVIGSSTPTYDSDGNVTNDFLHTYNWDANGRPVSIDGVTVTYDALGRMAEQDHSGSYSQIVYSPSGTKLALMSGSTLQKGFVPLTGGSMAVYNSSGLAYYRHSDWIGSSRFASTPSRTMYSDGAYAPFGEPYAQTGTTDLFFTGMDQDTVSNLYDFPAREYGIQGRWPSPDPAGISSMHWDDPQTLNRYAYARNSPLTVTDPTGMDDSDACEMMAVGPVGMPCIDNSSNFGGWNEGAYYVGDDGGDDGGDDETGSQGTQQPPAGPIIVIVPTYPCAGGENDINNPIESGEGGSGSGAACQFGGQCDASFASCSANLGGDSSYVQGGGMTAIPPGWVNPSNAQIGTSPLAAATATTPDAKGYNINTDPWQISNAGEYQQLLVGGVPVLQWALPPPTGVGSNNAGIPQMSYTVPMPIAINYTLAKKCAKRSKTVASSPGSSFTQTFLTCMEQAN